MLSCIELLILNELNDFYFWIIQFHILHPLTDYLQNQILYWYMFLYVSFLLDIFFILTTAYYLSTPDNDSKPTQSVFKYFLCCSKKQQALAAESTVFNANQVDL